MMSFMGKVDYCMMDEDKGSYVDKYWHLVVQMKNSPCQEWKNYRWANDTTFRSVDPHKNKQEGSKGLFLMYFFVDDNLIIILHYKKTTFYFQHIFLLLYKL